MTDSRDIERAQREKRSIENAIKRLRDRGLQVVNVRDTDDIYNVGFSDNCIATIKRSEILVFESGFRFGLDSATRSLEKLVKGSEE